MIKNGLDITTILTKQTDKQADLALQLEQMSEKKGKFNPSHFLKFHLFSIIQEHLVLPKFTEWNLLQYINSQFQSHPKKAVVI